MNGGKLNSVAEVLALIDGGVEALPAGSLSLETAIGCVLAEDIFADADQPAFDRSAVDGFAVADGNVAGAYDIAGEILPGDSAPNTPAAGRAWRISTGSAVPAGSAIVMIEDAEVSGGRVTLNRAAETRFIRRRGSSIQAGSRLLAKGSRIGAGEVAVLASVGIAAIRAIPRPRVLHITTGREIVPGDASPGPGQIRDTNGPLVHALLRGAEAEPLARCHVDESVESLAGAVMRSGAFDLLLVSGGSSVGLYDHTSQALEALGFSILSRRVNARPGKPLIVARRGRQWAFGLPGNPVSHFAAFHVFVARALRRLAGRPAPSGVWAHLGADLPEITGPHETFWPAWVEFSRTGPTVKPLSWLDSGDLKALIGVNALIHVAANARLVAGQAVEVVLCGADFPFA
jgi:molybdopterin molybdotransferase